MCTCDNQLQPHDPLTVCPAPPGGFAAGIERERLAIAREIHDQELDELREKHWQDHGGEA